jgi:hypothetical protein
MPSKTPKRYWLTFLWILPAFIWSVMLVFFLWLFWGKRLFFVRRVLCMDFKPKSWPCRSWYRVKREGKPIENRTELWDTHGRWLTWGGTTFVGAMILGPGRAGKDYKVIDTEVEDHEHKHIEQAEAAQAVAMAYAVAIALRTEDYWLAGIIWATGAPVYYLASVFQAFMRGEDPYRGSHLEERAYLEGELRNLQAVNNNLVDRCRQAYCKTENAVENLNKMEQQNAKLESDNERLRREAIALNTAINNYY